LKGSAVRSLGAVIVVETFVCAVLSVLSVLAVLAVQESLLPCGLTCHEMRGSPEVWRHLQKTNNNNTTTHLAHMHMWSYVTKVRRSDLLIEGGQFRAPYPTPSDLGRARAGASEGGDS